MCLSFKTELRGRGEEDISGFDTHKSTIHFYKIMTNWSVLNWTWIRCMWLSPLATWWLDPTLLHKSVKNDPYFNQCFCCHWGLKGKAKGNRRWIQMQLLTGQEAGLRGNKRRAFTKQSWMQQKTRCMKRKWIQDQKPKVATQQQDNVTTKTVQQSAKKKAKYKSKMKVQLKHGKTRTHNPKTTYHGETGDRRNSGRTSCRQTQWMDKGWMGNKGLNTRHW